MRRATQRRTVLAVGAVLAGTALAVLVVTRWVAIPWMVVGPSMAPTLEHGDLVLVDRWSYGRREPRPGEIALLAGPRGVPLVKRVLRGPLPRGERIGDLVDPTRPREPLFWVEGDNRALSADSRQFGPVPRGRFRGRVFFRYWPLSAVGPIRTRTDPATLPVR
ncbi:MAG TPA: S26 family signal peptidase [Candidatus Polarisedimenticolaceae bacterium]|nr:S26 family signal peptidase [Candidatus Polarisedimenticolaceae bacterium]